VSAGPSRPRAHPVWPHSGPPYPIGRRSHWADQRDRRPASARDRFSLDADGERLAEARQARETFLDDYDRRSGYDQGDDPARPASRRWALLVLCSVAGGTAFALSARGMDLAAALVGVISRAVG
jgi:hypothetical protein